MKHLISIFVVLFLLGACQTATTEQSSDSHAIISVDEFLSQPESFVDQMVSVSGLITHVCMHGGQKLFIAGKEEGNFLRIDAGEKLTEFPINLEGNMAEFHGLVVRMEPVVSINKPISEDHNHEGHACSAEQLSNARTNYYITASNFNLIK